MGVKDGVYVGKGIDVVVGTNVSMGDRTIVGSGVWVCKILVGIELEEHPTNVVRKTVNVNHLNFIFPPISDRGLVTISILLLAFIDEKSQTKTALTFASAVFVTLS